MKHSGEQRKHAVGIKYGSTLHDRRQEVSMITNNTKMSPELPKMRPKSKKTSHLNYMRVTLGQVWSFQLRPKTVPTMAKIMPNNQPGVSR